MALLDCEPLVDVGKFLYLFLMFIANFKGTGENRNSLNLTRSALSCL